jgi:multisubunit Na+/H+ antiporter MnhG subunit
MRITTRSSPAALAAACLAVGTIGYGYLRGAHAGGTAFVAVALVLSCVVALWSVRIYSDWLNPLALFIAIAMLRLGMPAGMLRFSEPLALFHWLPITRAHWDTGSVLAWLSVVAVIAGWILAPIQVRTAAARGASWMSRNWIFDRRHALAAGVSVGVGTLLLIYFLLANYGSVTAPLTSGVIRDRFSRVAGTSRYNFLGMGLLTYGSLILTAYFAVTRRKHWAIALSPALMAMLLLTPFGGRMVAVGPLVCAGIVLWYREERRQVVFRRAAVVFGGAMLTLVAFSSFVLSYRKGGGLGAASDALSTVGLKLYVDYAIWYEAGALLPYAVASYMPEGVLKGATVPTFGGIVGFLLGLSGTRPGAYMVERYVPPGGGGWGFHSGLPVDFYVNFGLAATVLASLCFGILFRCAYSSLEAQPQSAGVIAWHALLMWQLIWVYYEYVSILPDIFFIGGTFLCAVFVLSRVIPAQGGSSRATS